MAYFIDEHYLQGKWWKEKLFWLIQSINIMYPNMGNVIVVPTTKRMEITIGIQVCLISRINFDYKKNSGKLFLQIQNINIICPNVENMVVVPITKGMEIIMSIQVCLISWMNFGYKENVGKKNFSCKSKESISCSPMWIT